MTFDPANVGLEQFEGFEFNRHPITFIRSFHELDATPVGRQVVQADPIAVAALCSKTHVRGDLDARRAARNLLSSLVHRGREIQAGSTIVEPAHLCRHGAATEHSKLNRFTRPQLSGRFNAAPSVIQVEQLDLVAHAALANDVTPKADGAALTAPIARNLVGQFWFGRDDWAPREVFSLAMNAATAVYENPRPRSSESRVADNCCPVGGGDSNTDPKCTRIAQAVRQPLADSSIRTRSRVIHIGGATSDQVRRPLRSGKMLRSGAASRGAR